MYCNNCGAEVTEGTKFCPNCGAVIGINTTNTSNNSQQLNSLNSTKDKNSILRKFISPLVYYPAMVVLVILVLIVGKIGDSNSKDLDLSKLMGVDEATVADYFNVSVNELGIYPNDNALSVMCSDGYCNWISLSSGLDNYEKYNFAGVKVGDDKETTKTSLESKGFEFLEEHEVSDGISAFFTDKNRYTLTVQYQDGKAKNILYMNEPIDEMMEPIIDESDYQELVDVLEDTTNASEEDTEDTIETSEEDTVVVDAVEDGSDYDYSALTYAGRFEGWGGYSINFSPYTDVDSYEIGIAEIYYDGELSSKAHVFLCDDPGDWEGWDYDNLYEIRCDGYNEYLGFYIQDGTYMLDYNGPTKNYDTLEMIEAFEY